jgi:hypothetical protein
MAAIYIKNGRVVLGDRLKEARERAYGHKNGRMKTMPSPPKDVANNTPLRK